MHEQIKKSVGAELLPGSAAGSLVIKCAVPSPTIPKIRKKYAPLTSRPAKNSGKRDPATVPKIMARNVPSSSTPLPQESSASGSNSGSIPYFEGPKIAA